MISTVLKRIQLICFIVSIAMAGVAQALPEFTIAVITDLGVEQHSEQDALYMQELRTLTENEFKIEVMDYQLDWENDLFHQELDAIYANPKIDMLLLLGFAANQIAISRDRFPKPTFLPQVVAGELIGAPFENGVSGKRNLSYLTFSAQFSDSLLAFRDVIDYSKIAIIADSLVLKSIPTRARNEIVERVGDIRNQVLVHDGKNHDIIDQIEADVDVVMIGLLPRMPAESMQALIDGLIDRKLPGFTYIGDDLVHKGLLASTAKSGVLQNTARRNALNMQAVMLGDAASKLGVVIDLHTKLTINQNTAEKIGIAIDFKTLVDADLIGLGTGFGGQQYNLVSLMQAVLENNLTIKNEDYNLAIQHSEVANARGRLRPQLVADADYFRRKDNTSGVQSGFLSEQSADISVNLSQTLFSDSEFSNYKIQTLLLQASNEQHRQTQLDTILEAGLGMADVLQARAETSIQRENLSFTEKNLGLAVGRVKLGASSSADQYRWETQVANAKSAVFGAYTRFITAQQSLNRILNRELNDAFELAPLSIKEINIFTVPELFKLLDNSNTFQKVYKFGIAAAYERSPEIKQIEVLSVAKQRELRSIGRRRWLPSISLTGQVSENIDQVRVQSGSDGEQDWVVMLNARLPFYQGGQIFAQRQKAELELAQLANQMAQTKLQISQQLMANMNTSLTALFNLEFTKTAAAAAKRSLNLVTDAYTKGALPIVDLLDAQNASVNANLAEVQASIGFFRSSIQMQRVIGEFQFMMSQQQKENFREQFKSNLQK